MATFEQKQKIRKMARNKKPPLITNNFYKNALKKVKTYKKHKKLNVSSHKELSEIETIIIDGLILEKKENIIYNSHSYVYNKKEIEKVKKYKMMFQNVIIKRMKIFETNHEINKETKASNDNKTNKDKCVK